MKYVISSEIPPVKSSHVKRIERLFPESKFNWIRLSSFTTRKQSGFLRCLTARWPSVSSLFIPRHFFSSLDEISIYNFALSLRRGDILISSSGDYASHKVASKIKRLRSDISWIADFGDPWAGGELFPEYLPSRRLISWFEESQCLPIADIIFVTTFEYARRLRGLGRKHLVLWIPMGFEQNVPQYGGSGREMSGLQLLYAGSAFAHSRDLRPCMQASEELGCSFKIVGDTSKKFRSFAQKKAYTGIEFVGRVGSAEIRAFELECDMQVVVLNKTNAQIPGKLYQCLVDKPCIVICQVPPSREVLRLINASASAVMCENNVESIKRALIKLCAYDGQIVVSSYLRVFNWQFLAQRVDRKLGALN